MFSLPRNYRNQAFCIYDLTLPCYHSRTQLYHFPLPQSESVSPFQALLHHSLRSLSLLSQVLP